MQWWSGAEHTAINHQQVAETWSTTVLLLVCVVAASNDKKLGLSPVAFGQSAGCTLHGIGPAPKEGELPTKPCFGSMHSMALRDIKQAHFLIMCSPFG